MLQRRRTEELEPRGDDLPAEAPDPRPAGGPDWALWLQCLAARIRREPPGVGRDDALGEGWRLVHSYLLIYLRIHAGANRRISPEDREDLAAEKSLGILRKIALGEWDLDGRSPREIAGLLSTVAEHGLIDFLRGAERRSVPLEEARSEIESAPLARRSQLRRNPRPDEALEQREFAAALGDCVRRLPRRQQQIWWLRTLLGLSSRETASHPDVRLQAAHVDVILARCRARLRDCLGRKGFGSADLTPGCVLELYRLFQSRREDQEER